MINICFNGKAIALEKALSITQIIEKFGNLEGSFAVAVNKEFVPRSIQSETILSEGDEVELVVPMQGG